MSEFDRRLSKKFMDQLTSDVVLGENAWLCDMLRYWRPPGNLIGKHLGQPHALQADAQVLEENPKHLRLAIRNGYVNFYRGGQSVGKVGLNRRGKLRAIIHNKYVYGDEGKGQGYVTVTSAGFPKLGTGQLDCYGDIKTLDTWIARANSHGGDEKPFVDLVVAQNPNVIDLEMGLPAYSASLTERRAPRMDLVALEPIRDRWQVVFWEAKLAGDERARSRLTPKVLQQIEDYKRWLGNKDNRERVVHAYRRTCCLLVCLREIAKRFNPQIEELGAGIRAVAAPDAPLPLIDAEPCLLIDDRARDAAFDQHLRKLREECHLHVQMVQDINQMTLEARA